MHLTADDHQRVTDAVTAAERHTDGEIVTVVAGRSDAYHDVALHWTVLAMLSVVTLLALAPGIAIWLHALVAGAWSGDASPRALFTVALILLAVTFLAMRLLLAHMPLRLALTPGATTSRRVHARALALFRTGAEKRTVGMTGVLLYLSLDERRAEIVADEAIHSKVSTDVWGAAMAALVTEVRDGRAGEGMAQAVARIGVVLAEHFPKTDGNPNELPDRLIEL